MSCRDNFLSSWVESELSSKNAMIRQNPYCDIYCNTPGIFISVYYCPYYKSRVMKLASIHKVGKELIWQKEPKHTVIFSATHCVPRLLFKEK